MFVRSIRKHVWKGGLIKTFDAIADEVIGYVNKMKNTQSWKDGFSPAPLTLLNQERWNDGDVQQVRKVWEGGI